MILKRDEYVLNGWSRENNAFACIGARLIIIEWHSVELWDLIEHDDFREKKTR